MFGRRFRPSRLRQILDFVWPRIGWRRSTEYLVHRVGRMRGTPYAIAAGFASGAAISFTPLIGFHFVGAALLAWVLRGSMIASAVGTVVGNPWTFPLIWWAAYELGGRLVGRATPNFISERLTITHIRDNFADVFIPMMVGGTVIGVVAWGIFFVVVYRLVSEYRERRMRRRLLRAQRRASPGAE